LKLFNNIIHIGVREYHGEELKSQTIWLNKIALFTIFAVCINVSIHICLKINLIAIFFDLLYIITALSILIFQSKEQFKYAYYVVGIGYTLSFASSSVLIGAQNQIEYLIFTSILGTAILFDDKWIKRIFFIFGFLIFLGLKSFHIYFPKGLLESDLPSILSIINGIIVFSAIYIIVDKSLEDSNISLDRLLKKNEEITILNITLEDKAKKRTEEINEKSRTLERFNEELKRFSYIAAHDLREPLRNIIGFSKLMNRDIIKREFGKVEEYSSYINHSVWRIDAITRAIVDYAELENRLEEASEVDLNQIVDGIIESQKKIRKDVVFETQPFPTLEMNGILVTMLFYQMVINAIQYCDKPEPRVTIDCIRKGDFYQFSIIDNGIGVAPQFHEQIFVMFKRLHNDIKKNGSGIGLSIAKKIVEGYGGEMWLKSELGIGSTFYFTLPA